MISGSSSRYCHTFLVREQFWSRKMREKNYTKK